MNLFTGLTFSVVNEQVTVEWRATFSFMEWRISVLTKPKCFGDLLRWSPIILPSWDPCQCYFLLVNIQLQITVRGKQRQISRETIQVESSLEVVCSASRKEIWTNHRRTMNTLLKAISNEKLKAKNDEKLRPTDLWKNAPGISLTLFATFPHTSFLSHYLLLIPLNHRIKAEFSNYFRK